MRMVSTLIVLWVLLIKKETVDFMNKLKGNVSSAIINASSNVNLDQSRVK